MNRFVSLTGGIATGKSTCCRIIKELAREVVIFDADLCVAQLYHDREIHDVLRGFFGESVIERSGEVNKKYLRERVFASEDDRHFLESVFHPRVVQECLALRLKTVKNSPSCLFVADIPLLFEGEFELGQSMNLLVATTRKTQRERLKNRNGWEDDMVDAVLGSQMPIETKIPLADVVFWNEGPERQLQAQVERFLKSIECMD